MGRTTLDSHICSREELNLESDSEVSQKKFLLPDEQSRPIIDLYQQKFICLDDDNLFIYGDYNSLKARNMDMQLIRCHDRLDCKSESEITAYLRDKFLILMHNEVRFDSNKYGSEAIIQESRLQWIPVNT